MSRGKGFQGIIGNKKGSTWGTAVVPGAGDGVYALSLDPDGNTELVPDKTLTGKITKRPSLLGDHIVDVTLMVNLVFEGLEPSIAFLLGLAGAPSTIDTSARLHPLKLKDDIDGIFSTLAAEIMKDTQVVEIASVKWLSAELSGEPNSPITLTLKGIGFDYTDASATNTTTTIDTITYPSNREVAMFAQSSWEMNGQAAGALGSAPLYVIGWKVSIERALERIVTTRFGNRTDEPIVSDFGNVSGTFTFPVLQDGSGGNSSLVADQIAGTQKKAALTILGSTLAGAVTQKYQHKLWFPYLQLGKGKPKVNDAGKVVFEQPWEATHADADPTGWTAGYGAYSVVWDVISKRTTDALA